MLPVFSWLTHLHINNCKVSGKYSNCTSVMVWFCLHTEKKKTHIILLPSACPGLSKSGRSTALSRAGPFHSIPSWALITHTAMSLWGYRKLLAGSYFFVENSPESMFKFGKLWSGASGHSSGMGMWLSIVGYPLLEHKDKKAKALKICVSLYFYSISEDCRASSLYTVAVSMERHQN